MTFKPSKALFGSVLVLTAVLLLLNQRNIRTNPRQSGAPVVGCPIVSEYGEPLASIFVGIHPAPEVRKAYLASLDQKQPTCSGKKGFFQRVLSGFRLTSVHAQGCIDDNNCFGHYSVRRNNPCPYYCDIESDNYNTFDTDPTYGGYADGYHYGSPACAACSICQAIYCNNP